MNKDKENETSTASELSFGTIGFTRITSGKPISLFGSSMKHQNMIGLTIKRAEKTRELNQDTIFGYETLMKVEMSQAQFAELITNFGCGSGIPCTIIYTEKDGEIPMTSFENKRDEFRKEFTDELKEKSQNAKSLIKDVKELFGKKSALSKIEKEDILNRLQQIEYAFVENSAFMAKQFDKHIEKSVTEAKSEIEAFCENKMMQIASNHLLESQDSFLQDRPALNIEQQ